MCMTLSQVEKLRWTTAARRGPLSMVRSGGFIWWMEVGRTKIQIWLVAAIRPVPPIGKERRLPRVLALTSPALERWAIIAAGMFSWKAPAKRPGGILLEQLFTASAIMPAIQRAG